ncbi:FAD-dependent oxidoreductase [Draconibacterium halophilum]|uniref:FAD-dependent oxidoreductase n=1 Tax=Draconibacterium halophilum TaxID=2706887 RepID=A0A6C0R8H8_9BACT|nr:FAD-dependent oxidoreductase [Draconibacterium halophilum]QIA06714.1 FAD-dependent oxidoreductase [Draconibacterium halophilum]
MLAKKYKSEVVSIENPFEGIYTVEFASLRGKYKFLAGQFLHIALDDEYDGAGQWPESRCFSMQSSPGEKHIKITYAVKGDFTGLMENELKVGAEVWLKLPYGDLFQQNHKKTNTVFIAGGTGITPFLSLFNHESFLEYINPKIYLGFRSKEFNIYGEELSNLCASNPELNIIYQDEVGILNIEKIFEENGTDANYFISGPPEMIKAFKNNLLLFGVSAENVLTDDWE